MNASPIAGFAAHRWFLAVLVAIFAACNPGSESLPLPNPTDQAARPINDGELEPGEPGVMMIFHSYYGAMCTATLIGKRVLLTAKHCIMTEAGQLIPTGGWGVYVGLTPVGADLQHMRSLAQTLEGEGAGDVESAGVPQIELGLKLAVDGHSYPAGQPIGQALESDRIAGEREPDGAAVAEKVAVAGGSAGFLEPAAAEDETLLVAQFGLKGAVGQVSAVPDVDIVQTDIVVEGIGVSLVQHGD